MMCPSFTLMLLCMNDDNDNLALLVFAVLSAVSSLCFSLFAKNPACARRQDLDEDALIRTVFDFSGKAYMASDEDVFELVRGASAEERLALHALARITQGFDERAEDARCLNQTPGHPNFHSSWSGS